MNIKKRQIISTALSLVSVGGIIGTMILVRKTAEKEIYIKDEHAYINETEHAVDPKTTKIAILKAYIPALIVGGCTIASVISSTVISRKTEASLSAMALIADQGWRKYKNQVKQTLGLDKHSQVLKDIADKDFAKIKNKLNDKEDTRKLYFEEHVGYFYAEPIKIMGAYADLNQRMHTSEWGSHVAYGILDDFFKDAEAEFVEKNIPNEQLLWGWSLEYLLDQYECEWVGIDIIEDLTQDEKSFMVIQWVQEPIMNPGNSGEMFLNKDDEDDFPNTFYSSKPSMIGE